MAVTRSKSSADIDFELFEVAGSEKSISSIEQSQESGEKYEQGQLSDHFSADCSVSPGQARDPLELHFTDISRHSLLLFSDLAPPGWRLVHYSRLAAWILERVRAEAAHAEERWSCVVGETGAFTLCVSSQQMFEICFGHVTVVLFKTL